MNTSRLIILLLAFFSFSTMEAKLKTVKDVYLFGFSASFTDSTVYFTDIQKLDSALIETKGNMLIAREEYSRQLRSYFTNSKSDAHRTNVVFFGLDRKKAEKKLMKMKKLYTVKAKNKYNVVYLSEGDFKFSQINFDQSELEQ